MAGEKILIVDDETEIRDLIARYLTFEGLQAIHAENGMVALDLLRKNDFDLVILDIMLGDLDGFDILRRFRLDKPHVPVLFLSARRDDYDKILGFGLGADDYVTKPFSPAELTARIKAHIRRNISLKDSDKAEMIIARGHFSLNLKSYELYKREELIELSSTEIKLIKLFMENPNQVFTKKQIYRNVWENELYDDNSVMVYIRHLREKIEDNPKEPSYIQTVWGIGYKFCC